MDRWIGWVVCSHTLPINNVSLQTWKIGSKLCKRSCCLKGSLPTGRLTPAWKIHSLPNGIHLVWMTVFPWLGDLLPRMERPPPQPNHSEPLLLADISSSRLLRVFSPTLPELVARGEHSSAAQEMGPLHVSATDNNSSYVLVTWLTFHAFYYLDPISKLNRLLLDLKGKYGFVEKDSQEYGASKPQAKFPWDVDCPCAKAISPRGN